MRNIFTALTLAAFFMQFSACSNNFKGRQPSSFEAMAEIEKNESSDFYANNKYVFSYKLSQFIQKANDPSISDSSKKTQLSQSLNAARKSFKEQCDFIDNMMSGCGAITDAVDVFLEDLQTAVTQGQFSKAAQRANQALLLVNK